MDGLSIVSAISGVLVGTVKTAEKVFEITAVDEQAKALLQTVSQVSGQLNDARALRRQKSVLFTAAEKRIFEESFKHTDDAIRKVAALAEAPRADMSVSKGAKERVRLNTRLLFVLRDSPNIQVQLTQLGIASQSLNATLVTLMGREGRSRSIGSIERPPPSYEETMFLNERRQRNVSRRTSHMSLGANQSAASRTVDIRDDVSELGLDDHLLERSTSAPAFPRAASVRTYQDSEFLSASRARNSMRRARSDITSRPSTPSVLEQVPEGVTELAGDELFDDTRSVFSMASVHNSLYSAPPQGWDPDGFDSAAPRQIGHTAAAAGKARSQRWLEARCR